MILNQPFPAYTPTLSHWRSPMIAGLVVFLIILFFRPFGLSEVDSPYFPLHAFLYGMGTFITVALNCFVLPLLLPGWFAEKKWTVGREFLMMLWHVLTIAFINLAITRLLYGGGFSLSAVIRFLGYTAAIGIFPITITILMRYIMLLRSNRATASELDQQIHTEPEAIRQAPQVITLIGDYQNEVLELPADQIRFISSADNYVKVYYVEQNRLISKVLRGTLKKTEQGLQGYPQFFRCHRAYIANLEQVVHVSGNAQGLKLHLRDTEELIPVSRNLNHQLTDRLEQQKRFADHP